MDYDGVHQALHDGGDAVRPRPTTSTSLNTASNAVNVIAGVNSNNPVLSAAIQVLGPLSDVGKALPFVAPAFVLLKIIIDMEKRAVDVDAKCNDLVERITFMVSHLPALQKIEIMASTRQVIERMNDGIKAAAALIATYRKQGRVARRLSISNRDKFVDCAKTINSCCNDLLISLQMQQTVKLDILTRAVPVDEEDEAAERFVATNGGSVEDVVHNRALVRRFAHQRHLTMDDSVMEQLNTNIADSVQQNHIKLEGILKDNISDAIVNGLKNLGAEMLQAGTEQKFKCIQCNEEFTVFTNGPKACSFHPAECDFSGNYFPCCNTLHPCEFGAHRAKHHCDYPYTAFFPRARDVMFYSGNKEQWAAVEDINLDTDAIQRASAGELLRWAPDRLNVEENTLIIIVGIVWYKSPYYFNTFTAKEMEEITKSVRLSRQTLIFRTSPDAKEYASAEWILSESGEITGVRIAAQAATSSTPYIRVCPIDPATCTKSGDILTLSEGGMRTYIPATPYVLPQTLRIGPELQDEPSRTVRTNFKTRTSPALRVILKTMSNPPLNANPTLASWKFDYFNGTVSVFNNNAAGSANQVTIAGIKACYRMVGDAEYAPVEDCKFTDGSESLLPVTIEPRKSWQVNFQVTVLRTEEDAKLSVQWWNRAFLSRHRPVRIKLIIEDIAGEECSLVLEHVFKPYPYEKAGEKDLGFFFFDNPVMLTRCSLHVAPVAVEGKDCVLNISGHDITVKKLHEVVYHALKTGETEVDLKCGIEINGGEWKWAGYALVDISCQRVYAFKIILQEGQRVDFKRFGCIGYVLCPDYGKSLKETRSISYAKEIATLPLLEPYTLPEYPQDDTLDDFQSLVPPIPTAHNLSVSPLDLSASDLGSVIDRLNSRLDSIDTNVSRVVDTLERLVTVLRPPPSQRPYVQYMLFYFSLASLFCNVYVMLFMQ